MNLEQKKIQAELLRVQAARMELEIRIMEKQDEIKRMEDAIIIQINKETELTSKLRG